MMSNLTPREEDKTGANLSGISGDASRTLSLTYSNPCNVQVWVNGTFLHEDIDFTRSGQAITFVNRMFNTQLIAIRYYTFVSTSTADAVTTAEGVTRRYEYTKAREIVVDVIENVSDTLTGQQARDSTSHWIFEGFPNPADIGKPAPSGWKFPIIVIPFSEVETENKVLDASKQMIIHNFTVNVHSRSRTEANELAEEIKYLLDVRGQTSLRTACLHGPDMISSSNETDFIGGSKYYTKIMEFELKRFD